MSDEIKIDEQKVDEAPLPTLESTQLAAQEIIKNPEAITAELKSFADSLKVEDPKITAQKIATEKLAARVNELKSFVGKFFKHESGRGGIIEIKEYAGIITRQVGKGAEAVAERLHAFAVETNGARWTPPATEFLASHVEVPAPVKAGQQEVI